MIGFKHLHIWLLNWISEKSTFHGIRVKLWIVTSSYHMNISYNIKLLVINAPAKYLSYSLSLWFLEFAHLFLPCRVRGEEVTCTRHEGRGRKVFGFQLVLHQLCKSDLSIAFDLLMIYVQLILPETIFQIIRLFIVVKHL